MDAQGATEKRRRLLSIFYKASKQFANPLYEKHIAPHVFDDRCPLCIPLQVYFPIEQDKPATICADAYMMGLRCLYFFVRHILEFDKLTYEEHFPITRFLQTFYRRSDDRQKQGKLIMLPRGTYKTTIAAISYPIWRVVHNPNICILIYMAKEGLAKQRIFVIREIFNRHHKFRSLYGNYAPVRKSADIRWGLNGLQVSKRTKFFSDPTIAPAGVDAATTSGHYDEIIFDDIQDEINSASELERARVKRQFSLWTSLANDGGKCIVIGTRWHYYDVYQKIIKRDPFFYKSTKVIPAVDDNGKINFPSIFTKKILDGYRITQGEYLFNCNYMLRPLDPQKAMFKNVSEYEDDDIKDTPMTIYTIVDPATGEEESKQKAGKELDYSALIKIGVTPDFNFYVLRAEQGKWTAETLVDNIILFSHAKPKSLKTLVEGVAFQRMLKLPIEKRRIEMGIDLLVEIIQPPGNASKAQRGRMVEGYFQAGKVHIKKEHFKLKKQIIEFPYNEGHDDLVDALIYGILYAMPIQSHSKTRQDYYNYHQPVWSTTGY